MRFVRNNGCLDTGLLEPSEVMGIQNVYGLPVRVANPVLRISTVRHTGNRISNIPSNNQLASVTFGAATDRKDLN